MSARASGRRRRALVHLVLIGAALVVLVPVVWVVAAGFRTQISLLIGEFLFTPVLTNFNEVLFSQDLRLPRQLPQLPDRRPRQHGALPHGRDARGLVAAPHALAALGRRTSSSAGRSSST